MSRNTAAQQVAAPEKTLSRSARQQGEAATAAVPDADGAALATAMSGATAQYAAQSAPQTVPANGTTATAAAPRRPALKLSGLGITFQSLQRKQQTEVKKEAEITNKEEHEEFSQDMLDLQWLSMCNRMPQKMVGLASRMKNMKPRIADFPNIEIVVDNQMLLDQVAEIKGRIRVTLAKALHNGNVNIALRLAEAGEISRRMTKKEVFDELMKQKEVKAFVESMGLELT